MGHTGYSLGYPAGAIVKKVQKKCPLDKKNQLDAIDPEVGIHLDVTRRRLYTHWIY
jgi:hypothetical protein